MIIIGLTPSKRPCEKISNIFFLGILLTATPSQGLSAVLSIPGSARDYFQWHRGFFRAAPALAHPYPSGPTGRTPDRHCRVWVPGANVRRSTSRQVHTARWPSAE